MLNASRDKIIFISFSGKSKKKIETDCLLHDTSPKRHGDEILFNYFQLFENYYPLWPLTQITFFLNYPDVFFEINFLTWHIYHYSRKFLKKLSSLICQTQKPEAINHSRLKQFVALLWFFFLSLCLRTKKSWKPNGDSDMLLSVSFPPLRQNSYNTRLQMNFKFEKKKNIDFVN